MKSLFKYVTFTVLIVSLCPNEYFGIPIVSTTENGGGNGNKEDGVVSEGGSDSVEDEYWAWASSEELECSEEEFWHLGGKRCVPYYCPNGNSKRNHETGECLYKIESGVEEFEFGVGSTGWPIGSMGFFQPRGLSINSMYKMNGNGKRGGRAGFSGSLAGFRKRLQGKQTGVLDKGSSND